MSLAAYLPDVLFVLGLGFLVANVRAAVALIQWARRRPGALLVWAAPKPPFYAMSLTIGAAMGCLLASAYFVPRPLPAVFGELMMFVYYAGVVPLTSRIALGLYADGIWAESGFMPYEQIGGLRWLDGESPILVVASRLRTLARRLPVPGPRLGEVRRLLREKIAEHAIDIDSGPGLHLDGRDARNDV
ncbi:MAG: hypothetical protein AB7O28_25040 [Vicinamibacterales bacterium]